jgi:hypothetical protein
VRVSWDCVLWRGRHLPPCSGERACVCVFVCVCECVCICVSVWWWCVRARMSLPCSKRLSSFLASKPFARVGSRRPSLRNGYSEFKARVPMSLAVKLRRKKEGEDNHSNPVCCASSMWMTRSVRRPRHQRQPRRQRTAPTTAGVKRRFGKWKHPF